MAVLLKLSARARGKAIRSAALLGLAVGFGTFAGTQGSARVAMTPVIGNAFENPTNPAVLYRAQEPLGPARPRERVLTGNPLWAVPLESLSATRGRPLLPPSPHPPAPPVFAQFVPPVLLLPHPAEPEQPQLTLMGTIVGESGGVAFFLDETDKRIVRLRTGEDHKGWVLRSVQGREVELEKGGQGATLALPPPGGPPGPPPAAARAGNTWQDGDGQFIRPPAGQRSRPAAP